MTPRTLFTLILKTIGVYQIFSLIFGIPQILARMPLLWVDGSNLSETFFLLVLTLIISFGYFLLMRLIIFKTDWIIDKLSLDKHFDQEIIVIKADSLTVFQLAVIILGGIFFADALPNLLQEVTAFLQQKQLNMVLAKSPGFSYMVFDACKLTLGYLLITNSKRLSLWLDQRNNNKDANDTQPQV